MTNKELKIVLPIQYTLLVQSFITTLNAILNYISLYCTVCKIIKIFSDAKEREREREQAQFLDGFLSKFPNNGTSLQFTL